MAGVQRTGTEAELSAAMGLAAAAGGATDAGAKAHPARDTGPSGGAVTRGAVEPRVNTINAALKSMNVSLSFKIEENTGTVRIIVVDRETGEVIRTIPPDYFMRATADFNAAAGSKGLILDEGI
jgi:uncharacterized FlaG/YvyC family protein